MTFPSFAMIRYWMPAAGALLSICFGVGLIGLFGFFINPVAQAFDVPVGLVTTAPVLLIVIPALTGPVFGRLVDKFPVKWLVLGGVILAMSSLYSIGSASSISAAGLGFFGFALGLTISGPIALYSFLAKLYTDAAGKALAIAALGVSIAAAVLPLWVALLLEQGGWRETLETMAVTLLALQLIITLLFFPGSNAALPEVVARSEQAVEGASDQLRDDEPLIASEEQLGAEFLKCAEFWLIGLAVAIAMNAAMVFGIVFLPHLQQIGFDVQSAALVVSTAGLGGFIGKVLVASIIDRYRNAIKIPAMTLLLVQGTGIGIFSALDPGYTAFLVAFLLGFGGGAFIPMPPILNSRYFNAAIIGRVNGAQAPFLLPFGLVGAPLAGYAFDQTGDYRSVMITLAVLLVLAALLLMWLPKPAQSELTGSRVLS